MGERAKEFIRSRKSVAEFEFLEAEVARLDRLCAEWSRQNLAIVALEVEARKRSEAAERRLAEALEALKPFVYINPASAIPDERTIAIGVTVGEIRRARAALAQTEETQNSELCTFGPPAERKRLWLLKFEDADVGDCVFENEGDAINYFESVSDNYNCTLFVTARAALAQTGGKP